MHYYTLDKEVRKSAYVVLTIIALGLPSFFDSFKTFFGLSVSIGFSLSFGTIFGILYFLLDRVVWKWISSLINIPELDGIWDAEGISSFKDPVTGENYHFQMQVIIKQTFTKIEVFTETNDSTSRSTMASICTQHAVPIFRYSFENIPKNNANDELQRHPGLIELRVKSNELLEGSYFSGKHRLRYGELIYKRKKI